jgi:hypothetical protein
MRSLDYKSFDSTKLSLQTTEVEDKLGMKFKMIELKYKFDFSPDSKPEKFMLRTPARSGNNSKQTNT